MYHELKTWPEPFHMVEIGKKRFELRQNDRGFKTGDSIRLKEWSPESGQYTGREIVAKVGWITEWKPSLRDGHVCFALEQVIVC